MNIHDATNIPSASPKGGPVQCGQLKGTEQLFFGRLQSQGQSIPHKPQSSDENIADEKSNEISKINSGKPVNRVIKMVELRAKPYCAWSMR